MYGKHPATLPFGLNFNGNTYRNFSVRKVDGVFEEIFTHQNYANKHPQKWTGRVCAAILEELGGADIRSIFKASDYMAIPDQVKQLTIQDASYILMCGHIYTYGSKVDSVEQKCNHCGRVGEFKCDLNDVDVRIDPDPQDEVEVILPDGFVRSQQQANEGGGPLGIEGITWNKLIFKLPTLYHAIANERYYSMKKIADFNLRIAQTALKAVHSVSQDLDTGEWVTEHEMEDSTLNTMRGRLILNLLGADRRAIRAGFAKLDVTQLSVERECDCGTDMDVRIDVGDLYPLA